jgi:hypothetical protein
VFVGDGDVDGHETMPVVRVMGGSMRVWVMRAW